MLTSALRDASRRRLHRGRARPITQEPPCALCFLLALTFVFFVVGLYAGGFMAIVSGGWRRARSYSALE